MGNDNFVVKKRSTWVGVIKAILIIALLAFVAYKIYDKFFRKKVQKDLLDNAGDLPVDAPNLSEDADSISGDLLEADAADVIVDAE